MLQNPPRNLNWLPRGKQAHRIKLIFEWYSPQKIRKGVSEPFHAFYERAVMRMLGVTKLK